MCRLRVAPLSRRSHAGGLVRPRQIFARQRQCGRAAGKPQDLKQGTIVELENYPTGLSKALTARRIDALGANRQRLTTLSTATPGTRQLPDDLFDVPQNILVPKDRPVREDAREQHHNVAAEAQGWTA